MARCLVLSDTHYPFSIKGYEQFAYSVYKKYKCDTVIHCGDLVDFHAVDSHHEPEPDAKDANTELDEAINKSRLLFKLFPKGKLVLGNHDIRILKAAAKARLTSRMIVPFRELLQIPEGWTIDDNYTIDGVLYSHGEGYSGFAGHRTKALTEGQSCVIGHLHSFSGINYLANTNTLIWGMNVGCGIDRKAYSMRYGAYMKNKPTIGVGIVINGKPYYEVMDLGSKIVRK